MMIDGITNHRKRTVSAPRRVQGNPAARAASATRKTAQKGRHQTHSAQNRHDPRQITQAQRRYPASGCPKSESSEAIFVPRTIVGVAEAGTRKMERRPPQSAYPCQTHHSRPSLAHENTQRHLHEFCSVERSAPDDTVRGHGREAIKHLHSSKVTP